MKFNIPELFEQAQKVQKEIERVKEETKRIVVTADSGGEMVSVTMNGVNEVLKLKISPELVNMNDVEMLQDLVIAAMNKASKEIQEKVSSEMKKVSSILPNIPGLNLNI